LLENLPCAHLLLHSPPVFYYSNFILTETLLWVLRSGRGKSPLLGAHCRYVSCPQRPASASIPPATQAPGPLDVPCNRLCCAPFLVDSFLVIFWGGLFQRSMIKSRVLTAGAFRRFIRDLLFKSFFFRFLPSFFPRKSPRFCGRNHV
jgi:hypothetical protein